MKSGAPGALGGVKSSGKERRATMTDDQESIRRSEQEAPRSLSNRIKQVFGEDGDAQNYAEPYLEVVRVNMREAEARMRRGLIVLVLLILLFDLLSQAAV